MNILFLMLFLALNVVSVHGMDHKTITRKVIVSEDLKQARLSIEKALITQGPALDKHLRNGMRAVNRALKSKHAGFEDELASMQAFIQGMQDFHQNKDPDEILGHLVDVIHKPHTNETLKQMKSRAFGLVVALADEKKHTISNFYWIKHLLNSQPAEVISEGLNRFDTLFAQNAQEKNYKDLSELFRYSQILQDIKNLADGSSNTHAQFTMAKYHLFLAKCGKEMDGSPVDPRGQLKKALGYAQQAVAAEYEASLPLLQEIEALLKEYEPPSDEDETGEKTVLVTSLLDQEWEPPVRIFKLTVPPLQKVAPLKMLCALEIMKSGAGRQGHYFMGKKMIEHKEHVWDLGIASLERSAQLGNPFAFELMGDAFFDSDPQRAFVLYAQAFHIFQTAAPGSIYRLSGSFGRRQSPELKMQKLAETAGGITSYYDALLVGKNAVVEREFYEGDAYKKYVDQLAGIVLSHENAFVKNMHGVETSHLELLRTTGVLSYMEQFRSDRAVQDVLLTACSLRAHVGRGFILKEKTILAHYKKALQIILDPKGAASDVLHDPVSDDLLLKKIAIDKLPVQHRILYIDALFGVVEQWLANSALSPKEAEYVCKLFFLADAALHETKDTNLRSLHTHKCTALLKEVRKVATIAGSGDHLYRLGLRFIEQQDVQEAYAVMAEADPLCTADYHTEQGTTSEHRKQLAHIKNIQALVLWQQERTDEAYALYRQALQYTPDDVNLRWDFGERLVCSGNPAWRKEGLALIEQLSRTGKHRKSLEFMASCYGGEKTHLMPLNIDKAIVSMQLLIKDDPKEYFSHRLKLAVLYKVKANSVPSHEKRLLLTKALDLLHHYKMSRTDVHIQYMDILALLEKNQEMLHEMTQYVLPKESTVKEVLELAECYNKHANNQSLKRKICIKLRDRAEALLRCAAQSNDDAYYRLIELLLLAHKFQEIEHELRQERGQHMICLQEALRACTLLEQHGLKSFDNAFEHTERAFEVYQTFFESLPTDEGARQLIDLCMFLELGSAVEITHPMKKSSLSQITKLLDMINLLIIKGECSDEERCRILAYSGYLNVKLTLAWLKTEPGVTYDNVMAMLKKAVEVSQKTTDIPAKTKIMTLLSDQIERWQKDTVATACARAQMISQLVLLSAAVCKGTDAAIINNLLYASVVQAKSFVEKLDTSACSAEEIGKIKQQQALLAHILEKNCIKK